MLVAIVSAAHQASYAAHHSPILLLLVYVTPIPRSDAVVAFVVLIIVFAAMCLAGTRALTLLNVDLVLLGMAAFVVAVLVFAHE